MKQIDDLRILASSSWNPSVIALRETWLDPSIRASEVVSLPSEGTRTGMVVVWPFHFRVNLSS